MPSIRLIKNGEVIVFDNYYTKYDKAETFISILNANDVITRLQQDVKSHNMTAEKYAYLSKAYVFASKNKEAIKYAKEAIKKDKNYAYAYIRLAFVYARMGKKKEVLKYCEQARSLGQDNYLNSTFYIIFYDFCDKKEEADKLLDELELKNDNTPAYLYNLGFVYDVVKKDYNTAEYYYRKALDANYKDKYNLYTNLANCYSELRDVENAEMFVDKCLEFKKTEDMLDKKIDCLIFRQDYAQAKKLLNDLYKISDDKQTALIKLAMSTRDSGDTKNALRYYKFALKTTEATPALYYSIAYTYECFDKYQKAIEFYERMLEFDRKDAETYANISYCYSQLKDKNNAEKYIDIALKYDKSSYIFYRKARVLTEMQYYDKAIEFFTKSLDYDKTDLDCYQWISYCYSMMKNYEKSLEYANRALMLNNTEAYSYFRKAWALQEMGKYSESIEFYQKCIEYDDKYIDAYVNISYIYSKTGDLKHSMLYANKALLINKDYAYAHYRKAWVFQETGKFEEAMDGYSKAIELDPTDIYNYLGIACISLNTQANLNALLYANKALLIDRNCSGAYYYKSLALSNLGKTKEAERAYSIALQLGYNPSV